MPAFQGKLTEDEINVLSQWLAAKNKTNRLKEQDPHDTMQIRMHGDHEGLLYCTGI